MRRRYFLSIALSAAASALVTVGIMSGCRDRTGSPDGTGAPDARSPVVEMKGALRPVEVAKVYPPREARVNEFRVRPGDQIEPGFVVAGLYSDECAAEYARLQSELDEANAQNAAANELLSKPGISDADKLRILTDKKMAEARANRGIDSLRVLDAQYNFGRPNRRGHMIAVAPPFATNAPRSSRWTVLSDPRENPVGKTFRPNEELARLANLSGPWHIELKVSQRHVGRLLKAFADPSSHSTENDPAKGERKCLAADVFLSSRPDAGYAGRLYREDMAAEAVSTPDAPEPSVFAFVRVNLPGIPPEKRIPTDQFVVGLEARVTIRCEAPAVEPNK